jgi:hypothetical protein
MENYDILVSITTAGLTEQQWQKMIQDVSDFKLNKVALFLIGLNGDQRQLCYELLGKMENKPTIPFVHATSSMHPDEYNLLINEFGTLRFNLHPVRERPLKYELSDDLREKIYIENTWGLYRKDLYGFAGICLDVSHAESVFHLNDLVGYYRLMDILEMKQRWIGANHMSAVDCSGVVRSDGKKHYAPHFAKKLTDMNYLIRYKKFINPNFAAIELQNEISQQLIIKEYIEKLLNTCDFGCLETHPIGYKLAEEVNFEPNL